MQRLTARGAAPDLALGLMSSKYFAHFIAPPAPAGESGEWSGVIELTRPLQRARETRELALVLANSLDVELEDIRILEWSPLH